MCHVVVEPSRTRLCILRYQGYMLERPVVMGLIVELFIFIHLREYNDGI